jgi:glutamate-5-semialdehyde dehydrogenase
MADVKQQVHDAARRARIAAATLALTPRAGKDEALIAIADALVAASDEIIAANTKDVDTARAAGIGENVIDRLSLDEGRIRDFANGVRDIATLPDPVGEVVRGSTLPNGLQLQQIRVPMGVIGMIYEGRPNVTADAAAICLKAGNAVLLRGSSSASESNAAIINVMREALTGTAVPPDAIQQIAADDRTSATHLMQARGLVDLVIPRGGAGLINAVVAESTVPVIETGVGNCHVYVDADADLDMALDIVVNAKTHRTSVCNAAESLLVHKAVADTFVPRVVAALHEHGVTVHGDATFCCVDSTCHR